MTTLTNQSRNAATMTNQAFGVGGGVTASGGQYYGFGSFTYSGGQVTTPGHTPILSNQGRNSATLTNQSRN